MKSHVLWIAAGLLVGAGSGAAAVARATSCSIPFAEAHLELVSVTVDGAAADPATAPAAATFAQSARDPETDTFIGQHWLTVEDGAGVAQTFYMEYTP